jgi:hypothetical protein
MIGIATHEIFHALFMSPSLYSKYAFPNAAVTRNRDTPSGAKAATLIVTPKAKSEA